MNKAQEFFDNYKINPPLPDFGINYEAFQFENVPYVLMLRYDVKDISIETFQEELTKYASIKVDDVFATSDQKYYLNSLNYDGYFYVLIQAKEGEDEVLISNVKSIVDAYFGKKEDTPKENVTASYNEEAIDFDDDENEDDDMLETLGYELLIDVDITCPNDSHKTRHKGSYAYSLWQYSVYKKPIFVPFLDIFNIISFSLSEDTVLVEILLGDKRIRKEISKNKEETIKIEHEYNRIEGRLVVGEAKLSLRYYNYALNPNDKINDRLLIEYKLIDVNERRIAIHEKTKIKADNVLETEEKAVGHNVYQCLLVDEKRENAFVCVLAKDSFKACNLEYFVHASLDEVLVNETSFITDGHEYLETYSIRYKRGADD